MVSLVSVVSLLVSGLPAYVKGLPVVPGFPGLPGLPGLPDLSGLSGLLILFFGLRDRGKTQNQNGAEKVSICIKIFKRTINFSAWG